jgi:starch phosphorylase
MKILANGGLNVSEIDGWWAEAFSPDAGWAIGDGKEHGDDPGVDWAEAEQLYTILEQEIVPAFYTRNDKGIPTAWIEKMRESMARLTPAYSASRAVREYTEAHYLPAAAAYNARTAEGGKAGSAVYNWEQHLAAHWVHVRFGSVHVSERDGKHFFEAQVYTDEMDPGMVRVELYADALDQGNPVRIEMQRGERLAGAANGFMYSGQVQATRPAQDYTIRVTPYKAGAFLPLEAPQILWQK